MVTMENYEEYILLYIDGELDGVKEQELLDFVKLHLELQEELSMYQTAKLQPDTNHVFEHKHDLLKPVAAKTIDLRGWWRYGAAAGMIVLVLFSAIKWLNTETESPKIVHTEIPMREQIIEMVPEQKIIEPVVPIHQTIALTKKGVHSNTKKFVRDNVVNEKIEIAAIKPVTHEITNEVAYSVPSKLEMVEIPEVEIAVEVERDRRGFFARLPLNYKRNEGLKNLKEGVEERIAQAKQITESVKDTEVTFKIGNKELIVFNF